MKKVGYIKINPRFVLLFLSFTFIGIGIIREEYLIVLKKAVKICLECIGVG